MALSQESHIIIVTYNRDMTNGNFTAAHEWRDHRSFFWYRNQRMDQPESAAARSDEAISKTWHKHYFDRWLPLVVRPSFSLYSLTISFIADRLLAWTSGNLDDENLDFAIERFAIVPSQPQWSLISRACQVEKPLWHFFCG